MKKIDKGKCYKRPQWMHAGLLKRKGRSFRTMFKILEQDENGTFTQYQLDNAAKDFRHAIKNNNYAIVDDGQCIVITN